MSAGYLGSKGTKFRQELGLQRSLVDQKLPQDFKDIGGILGSKNIYFSRTYKGIHGSCYDIHNRRKTTITAHAYQRNGDKTIKFKHSEIKTYMKKQKELIESILADFPL
jgi:hypothetical protein